MKKKQSNKQLIIAIIKSAVLLAITLALIIASTIAWFAKSSHPKTGTFVAQTEKQSVIIRFYHFKKSDAERDDFEPIPDDDLLIRDEGNFRYEKVFDSQNPIETPQIMLPLIPGDHEYVMLEFSFGKVGDADAKIDITLANITWDSVVKQELREHLVNKMFVNVYSPAIADAPYIDDNCDKFLLMQLASSWNTKIVNKKTVEAGKFHRIFFNYHMSLDAELEDENGEIQGGSLGNIGKIVLEL